MAAHLAPTGPMTTCAICQYDMIGAAPGDLCPECGSRFDQRPEWRDAERHVRTWLFTSILAIATMPLLAPISLIFLLITAWEMRDLKTVRKSFRIQDRHLRKTRWVGWLVWFGVAEFLLVLVVYSWLDWL